MLYSGLINVWNLETDMSNLSRIMSPIAIRAIRMATLRRRKPTGIHILRIAVILTAVPIARLRSSFMLLYQA